VSLTENEIKVLADAWTVFQTERERRRTDPDYRLWLAVEDEHLPAAHSLAESGRLERRVGDEAMEWRLTDPQAVGFELGRLLDTAGREN
jgi:hypothetical protein